MYLTRNKFKENKSYYPIIPQNIYIYSIIYVYIHMCVFNGNDKDNPRFENRVK